MKTGKIWGLTEDLLATPFVEVHRIEVAPNHHCSWHIHKSKHNAFYVMMGTLIIEEEKSYGLIDRTYLRTGDMCSVAPGANHRFVTEGEGVLALEIYYPEPTTGSDIVRSDNGGPNLPA